MLDYWQIDSVQIHMGVRTHTGVSGYEFRWEHGHTTTEAITIIYEMIGYYRQCLLLYEDLKNKSCPKML